MKILRQPTNQTCGQTCVAMLADVPVEEVCAAIGKRGSTKTRDVISALRAFGLRCHHRLVPLSSAPLAVRAVAKVSPPRGSGWHWVVWADGRYFDPQVGLAYEADEFTNLATSLGWRVTSILPVSPP